MRKTASLKSSHFKGSNFLDLIFISCISGVVCWAAVAQDRCGTLVLFDTLVILLTKAAEMPLFLCLGSSKSLRRQA